MMKSTTPEPAVAAVAISPNREIAGLLLLALALLFNAVLLAPEARIERVPVNDLPFQMGASVRIGESIAHAEPFLDPWVSQWSLGFPLWRIYQPLPHIVAAAVIALCHPFASPSSSFAFFYYLLLVLLPASCYLGARLMGFNPVAAGLASILILTPSEGGDFGRYGLSYGAYVWRGSGLYTELFALVVMLPAFGLVARAIDTGTRRTSAALGLALTALSHIFFGYIAFVSTAVWALASPREGRPRRIARAVSIAGMAMLLLLWFVVPMWLAGSEVNRSRWDPAYKFDSYGASIILSELFSGRLLDYGRFPVLSLMVALGVFLAAFDFKDQLPRRLLCLTAVWLALFFGRETWGYLLLLVGVPSLFHLHRLQAAFELFAILMAAWGLERVIAAAMQAPRQVTIAVGAALGMAILMLALNRAEFLTINTITGEATLAAFERERGDLEASLADVDAILAKRPGRVSAGKAADWGESFKVGEAKVYSFLSRYRLDEATNLYHTISRTSDYMVLRDENNPAEEDFFAIRAVLAPVTLIPPSNFRRRSVHGRFAVYEVSDEGYFSLVDLGASYDGPPATWYDPIAKWLPSWMLRAGEVIALNSGPFPGVPVIGQWQALPAPNIQFMKPRGRIVNESKVGETYRATFDVLRPCYAYLKITYFPSLVATVDGRRERLIRVFPDFAALALTPGHHEVEVSYQPGPLKPFLFIAGILMFVLVARGSLGAYWERGENWLEERVALLNARLSTEPAKMTIALAVLILLFTRSLFRGLLVDGHDSLAYPPRLTEFARIIGEQFPPVWAPELSNGHGQPLFEFFPPLAYLTQLPLYKLGLRLADCIQFPLAVLFAIGAIAVYFIGRRLSFSRFASVGAAAAWLFAPYQAIDVYVSVRVAEATAIALVPLALLALIYVLDRPTLRGILLASPAIALIPLAHNVIALLMLPIFALLVVARASISDRPWRTAAAGASAIVGGLALSAFFWIPSLIEKNFAKTDISGVGFFHWSVHIIAPWQLLWGRWGFGTSVAGPNDGMSFALGLLPIALAIAGFVIARRSLNRTRRVDAAVFAFAALAGAFMSIEWSSIIWRHVSILQYLQFPWRVECLPALFMPLLALYAFERIGARATMITVVLLVLFNIQHTQPKGYLKFDDEFYAPQSIAERGLETTMYWAEPHGVEVRLGYTGNGLIRPPSGMAVRTLSRTSVRHEYDVVAPVAAGVMDSTNYFPGWTVLIDGRETAVKPMAPFGLISFGVPAGRHDIIVELRPTPVRHFASLISILALVILLTTLAVSNAGMALEDWHDRLATNRAKIATGLIVGLILSAAIDSSGMIAGLFAAVIMLAIIGFGLAPYLVPLIRGRDSRFWRALIILGAIALAKIVVLPSFPGFEGDIRLFGTWARQVATLGPALTYQPGFFLDYPPGYLYALWPVGLLARELNASGLLLRILVESPALFADFLLAATVYGFVRREYSDRAALLAMLMVALNPALLYDTVVWGQCDSVIAFIMLLSVLSLMLDRYELGFAIAAISVLVKPQGLMLLPVLVLWTLRHADRQTWIRSMLAFIATALIVITPFQIGHSWNWIIDLYASTAASYHETSVNAFNLLALLGGLRMPDSNLIAGHSYYAIGMLLLVPLYAFIAWIVWTARTSRPLLFAAFISIFGFFMLAPRMHERYIYAAIVLAAPLALEAPVMGAMFTILTLTGLFNLAYVLHTIQLPSMPGTVILLDPRDGLAMAVSAFNLVALTMAAYFGASAVTKQVDAPKTRPDAGAPPDEPPAKAALSG